ncbi:hypothetical protein GGR53DRAFT_424588 [Hypoxylon sp. FL1150]|nr:hypothetical protein GGR53DRAFT_424588 [Hypoxylon sp. FL1150]
MSSTTLLMPLMLINKNRESSLEQSSPKALLPPNAQVVDVVVQFWNCDAAIMMRLVKTTDTDNMSHVLIGRVDIADIVDRATTLAQHQYAVRCMPGLRPSKSITVLENTRAVYVDMTLRTLQLITATLPST